MYYIISWDIFTCRNNDYNFLWYHKNSWKHEYMRAESIAWKTALIPSFMPISWQCTYIYLLCFVNLNTSNNIGDTKGCCNAQSFRDHKRFLNRCNSITKILLLRYGNIAAYFPLINAMNAIMSSYCVICWMQINAM